MSYLIASLVILATSVSCSTQIEPYSNGTAKLVLDNSTSLLESLIVAESSPIISNETTIKREEPNIKPTNIYSDRNSTQLSSLKHQNDRKHIKPERSSDSWYSESRWKQSTTFGRKVQPSSSRLEKNDFVSIGNSKEQTGMSSGGSDCVKSDSCSVSNQFDVDDSIEENEKWMSSSSTQKNGVKSGSLVRGEPDQTDSSEELKVKLKKKPKLRGKSPKKIGSDDNIKTSIENNKKSERDKLTSRDIPEANSSEMDTESKDIAQTDSGDISEKSSNDNESGKDKKVTLSEDYFDFFKDFKPIEQELSKKSSESEQEIQNEIEEPNKQDEEQVEKQEERYVVERKMEKKAKKGKPKKESKEKKVIQVKEKALVEEEKVEPVKEVKEVVQVDKVKHEEEPKIQAENVESKPMPKDEEKPKEKEHDKMHHKPHIEVHEHKHFEHHQHLNMVQHEAPQQEGEHEQVHMDHHHHHHSEEGIPIEGLGHNHHELEHNHHDEEEIHHHEQPPLENSHGELGHEHLSHSLPMDMHHHQPIPIKEEWIAPDVIEHHAPSHEHEHEQHHQHHGPIIIEDHSMLHKNPEEMIHHSHEIINHPHGMGLSPVGIRPLMGAFSAMKPSKQAPLNKVNGSNNKQNNNNNNKSNNNNDKMIHNDAKRNQKNLHQNNNEALKKPEGNMFMGDNRVHYNRFN